MNNGCTIQTDERARPNLCCQRNLTTSSPIKKLHKPLVLAFCTIQLLSIHYPCLLFLQIFPLSSSTHQFYFFAYLSPLSTCLPANPLSLYSCFLPAISFYPAPICPPSCFSCLPPYPLSLNPVKLLAHSPLPIYCPYLSTPHPNNICIPSTILVLSPFTITFIISILYAAPPPRPYSLPEGKTGSNTGYILF